MLLNTQIKFKSYIYTFFNKYYYIIIFLIFVEFFKVNVLIGILQSIHNYTFEIIKTLLMIEKPAMFIHSQNLIIIKIKKYLIKQTNDF